MIFFSLLAVVAMLAGTAIMLVAKSSVHEIEAGVCFIVGAVFCACAMLVSIGEKLSAIRKLLTAGQDREKDADEVATKRWESLADTLSKLAAANQQRRAVSNVGEDWDLPPTEPATPAPFTVQCAKCHAPLKASAKMIGRTARCPKCGAAVAIASPSTLTM